MMTESVRQFYQDKLREHYEREAIAGRRLPLVDKNDFVADNAAAWRHNLPASLLKVFDYYRREFDGKDRGKTSLNELKAGKIITFVIRVTTDGDDGWLEVFTRQGELIGSARTFLEQIYWGEPEEIRSLVKNGDFTAEMDKLIQASRAERS